jgi:DNA polymerase III subunit epsilon
VYEARTEAATRSGSRPGLSGSRAILANVGQTNDRWGRPATEPGVGWAVVDVETSGFRPGQARVVSVAALVVGDDGNVERSFSSLLNPGVDPGPTHVHGLTAEMLEGQPTFGEVFGELAEVLAGRTLVAHNVAFDYSFLTAEAELVDAVLPVDTVMCTVELARRLNLGTANLRLETVAAHYGATQIRPHDALDDAMVLAQILKPALAAAGDTKRWLPIRTVTRKRWPSGHITHDELRPLKVLASRLPCDYANPGLFVRDRPLVQGMRVALSSEMNRTHEETIERILNAGLSYTDTVDGQTSLVVCNEPEPGQGKGFQARELGVPVVDDEHFVALLGQVVGGSDMEQFTDHAPVGDQFTLF